MSKKKNILIKCLSIMLILLSFFGLLFCNSFKINNVKASEITEFYNGKSYFLNFSSASVSDGVALERGYNDFPLKFITLFDTYDGVALIKDITGLTNDLTSIIIYKTLEDGRNVGKTIWSSDDGIKVPLETLICTNIDNMDYILNSPLSYYVGIGGNSKVLSLNESITGRLVSNNNAPSYQLNDYFINTNYDYSYYLLTLQLNTIIPIKTNREFGFMQSDFNELLIYYFVDVNQEGGVESTMPYTLIYRDVITSDNLYQGAPHDDMKIEVKEQMLSYRDIAFLLSIFDFRTVLVENDMLNVIDSVVKAPFEAVFNALDIEILGYSIIGILSTIILLIICFKIIKRIW